MASTLSDYKNAASNREMKIERAIKSVLAQSEESWELIVVSDGCLKTMRIVTPYVYDNLPRIRLLSIPKQKLWSSAVRNAGIFKAEGEIILYLDNDDVFGENHLKKINETWWDNDWAFFNDLVWNGKEFVENPCNMNVKGQCGTSNVAHKRSLGAYWNNSTYLHDFQFIKTLQALSSNYSVIPCAEYKICHRPGKYHYDI